MFFFLLLLSFAAGFFNMAYETVQGGSDEIVRQAKLVKIEEELEVEKIFTTSSFSGTGLDLRQLELRQLLLLLRQFLLD